MEGYTSRTASRTARRTYCKEDVATDDTRRKALCCAKTDLSHAPWSKREIDLMAWVAFCRSVTRRRQAVAKTRKSTIQIAFRSWREHLAVMKQREAILHLCTAMNQRESILCLQHAFSKMRSGVTFDRVVQGGTHLLGVLQGHKLAQRFYKWSALVKRVHKLQETLARLDLRLAFTLLMTNSKVEEEIPPIELVTIPKQTLEQKTLTLSKVTQTKSESLKEEESQPSKSPITTKRTVKNVQPIVQAIQLCILNRAFKKWKHRPRIICHGLPKQGHCRCVYDVCKNGHCKCPLEHHLLRRVEALHDLIARGMNSGKEQYRILSHVAQIETGLPKKNNKNLTPSTFVVEVLQQNHHRKNVNGICSASSKPLRHSMTRW